MISHFSLIQFLLVVLSAAFIIDRSRRFIRKERDQSIFKLSLTIFVWANIMMIAIYPKLAYDISDAIGLGKNLDSLIFMGFIIVFMIVYKLLSIIERVEKNVTDIIRKQAIESFKQSVAKRR
jgi:small membrane protein